MRKFDYTFLKKISVPADIMNSATETDAGRNIAP